MSLVLTHTKQGLKEAIALIEDYILDHHSNEELFEGYAKDLVRALCILKNLREEIASPAER